MATFAPGFRDKLLNQQWDGTGYVATNTADPGTTGASLSSGAREPSTFATSSSQARQGSLVTARTGGATVTHYSVWDAATGGNFLFGGALPSSQSADFPLIVTLKD